MSALGYIAYLGFIFLPGIGAGELLNIWRRSDDFTGRLGYAFGLGIGIDTVTMVVRTAGVTSLLKGVDPATLYTIIAFGALMLGSSVALRRRFSWWVRPRKLDYAFLAIILLQAVIIVLYLQKYPIYPSVYTTDFSIHVRDTLGLIAGSNTSIPHGILYDGAYYQTAPAVVLVGGSALTTIRWTMSLLALFSPFLFYLLAARLSGSQFAGLLVALLFVVSGPVWFQMIFLLGLYSNFFGILAAIFLLVAFLDFSLSATTIGATVVLLIATIMVYFSHYSAVTVFPAILLFPFVNFLINRKNRITHSLIGAGIVLIPGLVGVILYQHILFRLFLADRAAVPLYGSTALSSLVSEWPFLSYMIFRTSSDLAFIFLAALACVFVWRFAASKAAVPLLMAIWFVTIAAAAPFDVTAWRYSLEALVPLTLMSGIGLFMLLPRSKAGKGRHDPKSYYWKIALVLILIVPPITTSWGSQAIADAVTDPSLASQDQILVNESITWLGVNTPTNATYLSVSDLWFIYTKPEIDRTTIYRFESTPSEALQYAEEINATYIMVTSVSSAYQSNPSLYPWNTFPTSDTNSNLTLVYQNPGVRVYKIV